MKLPSGDVLLRVAIATVILCAAAVAMPSPRRARSSVVHVAAREVPALRTTQAERFLGFEIGEEIRYVLGPEESLIRGETGMWSIRLDEIYAGDDGTPEAAFALRHEWQAPQPVAEPPLRTVMRVKSEGTLRVNVHGFPLFIHFETVRHLAGLGDEAYTIDYELEEDHRGYDKRMTLEGNRWYHRVAIRDHDTVKRDPPSGLFAFLPAVPGCLDLYVATYGDVVGAVQPQPRNAASPPPGQQTPSGPLRVANNADCEESLFANPGLLNLAMPAFWEAQGRREYVFFTPIGPTGEPASGLQMAVPPTSGGVPVLPGSTAGGRPVGGGFPARMPTVAGDTLSPSTYHEVDELRFIERVAVRVGARTQDAWLVETSADIGPIYVDDDGVVLRIDLPTPDGAPQRYLRRLWPSEF